MESCVCEKWKGGHTGVCEEMQKEACSWPGVSLLHEKRVSRWHKLSCSDLLIAR
jgi:hypothetical protein